MTITLYYRGNSSNPISNINKFIPWKYNSILNNFDITITTIIVTITIILNIYIALIYEITQSTVNVTITINYYVKLVANDIGYIFNVTYFVCNYFYIIFKHEWPFLSLRPIILLRLDGWLFVKPFKYEGHTAVDPPCLFSWQTLIRLKNVTLSVD